MGRDVADSIVTDAGRPPIRALDVVKLAIVAACWIVGLVLRFQPMPARVVGGGLLIAGTLLLAFWAHRERLARRAK